MTRLLVAAFIAVLALPGLAAPALAHTQLISSDPAKGATITGPPAQLTLTFNEPVAAATAKVTVTDAAGSKWTTGALAGQNATLVVPVTPTTGWGRQVIEWAVAGSDGHEVTGTIDFAMQPPAPVPPTATSASETPTPASPPAPAPAAQSESGGFATWLGIFVGLLVGAAIALGAYFFIRRRNAT